MTTNELATSDFFEFDSELSLMMKEAVDIRKKIKQVILEHLGDKRDDLNQMFKKDFDETSLNIEDQIFFEMHINWSSKNLKESLVLIFSKYALTPDCGKLLPHVIEYDLLKRNIHEYFLNRINESRHVIKCFKLNALGMFCLWLKFYKDDLLHEQNLDNQKFLIKLIAELSKEIIAIKQNYIKSKTGK